MKSSVRGSWPIAMNRPVTGRSESSPVLTLRSFRPESFWSPWTSATSLSHTNVILGSAKARSCIALEARRVSRRWTIVTDFAKRERNVASSIAVSPPPITAMSWSLKKKPSQVAHQETPRPDRASSFGRPSLRCWEPVVTMTALAWWTVPAVSVTVLISPVRSTLTTSSGISSAPKRSAWARMLSMSSGPMIPSWKPGKFSTSVVFISAPPAVTAPSNTSGLSDARAV